MLQVYLNNNTKAQITMNPQEKENAEKTDEKKQYTNQQSKTSSSQSEQSNTNGMPDWVMHLLTGAGSVGANYLLFVKPLQDKFEAMNKAIENLIVETKELKEQLKSIKQKQIQGNEEEAKYNKEKQLQEAELFNLRNNKSNSNLNGAYRKVHF